MKKAAFSLTPPPFPPKNGPQNLTNFQFNPSPPLKSLLPADFHPLAFPTTTYLLLTFPQQVHYCFSSGRHYWYNISADMDCKDYYPMFLLYNRDRLTGFGWVAIGNADSPRYEHPPPNRLKVSETTQTPYILSVKETRKVMGNIFHLIIVYTRGFILRLNNRPFA